MRWKRSYLMYNPSDSHILMLQFLCCGSIRWFIQVLFLPYYYSLFSSMAPLSKPNHYVKQPQERFKFAKQCFDSLKMSGSQGNRRSDGHEDTIYYKFYLGLWTSQPIFVRKPLNYFFLFFPRQSITVHVLEGWFFGTPITQIKYENFFEWCSWAFFGKEGNICLHENHLSIQKSNVASYETKWSCCIR